MRPESFQRTQEWLGLSNVDLADALGVSPQSVYAWRIGTNSIPTSIEKLLAFMLREKAIMTAGAMSKILNIPLKRIEVYRGEETGTKLV